MQLKNKAYSTLNIAMLVLSMVLAAMPAAFANTITGRPTVYVDNVTADPLEVEAGAHVNITLDNMTITGAQVWLWLSSYGGAEINTALGDRWYAGPFYMGDVISATPENYSFTPPEPFVQEGRTYTFVVGNNWINGTIPLLVQPGVDYWIKIADIAPRDVIPPTEVGVSTNRISFVPSYMVSPSTVAPNTIIRVSGYATPVPEYYNISQTGTLFNDTSVTSWTRLLVPSTLISKQDPWGTWNYTGFTTSFPAMDLMMRLPNSAGTITVNVVRNSTGVYVHNSTLAQLPRAVQLPSPENKDDYGHNYTTTVELLTGSKYNVTLNWFPASGSFQIFLNTTLVASGTLNATGGIYNFTITIPDLTTGRYMFRVIDNLNVEYNFLVNVTMVPYILVDPASGHVGDSFTVIGRNFLDYVGQRVTIYFQNSTGASYVLLANFTVTAASWSMSLTVPHAAGGDRSVEAREIDGVEVIDSTTFTVLPKLEVAPSVIKNDGSPFFALGTGFNPTKTYTVNVDNQAFLPGNLTITCDDYGDLNITLIAAGFRPGLHVVALYEYGVAGAPPAYSAVFTVTVEGDPIVELLRSMNATLVEIRDGMAIIQAGQEELQVSLSAINATLVDLITNAKGEVLVAIDTALGTVTTKLDDLDAKIVAINGTVATISTAVGDIQASLSDLDAKIVSIDGTVATINTNVGEVKTSLSSIDAKLVSLDDHVATISTVVGDVNASISDIITAIESVGNDAVEIKTTLGTISGKVTSTDGTVATIKTDVGTVKADISTIKGYFPITVDMTPVWAAVVLSLIAAIAAIYAVITIRRKIAG